MAFENPKPFVSLESIVAEARENFVEVMSEALPKAFGHLAARQTLFPVEPYVIAYVGSKRLERAGQLEQPSEDVDAAQGNQLGPIPFVLREVIKLEDIPVLQAA